MVGGASAAAGLIVTILSNYVDTIMGTGNLGKREREPDDTGRVDYNGAMNGPWGEIVPASQDYSIEHIELQRSGGTSSSHGPDYFARRRYAQFNPF